MVTLANVQGSSLIPDIGNFADAVRKDIGGAQERARAEKAQTTLQDQISQLLGGAPSKGVGTKASTEGLSVLGKLAPDLARETQRLVGEGGPNEVLEFRDGMTRNLGLATDISKASSFAGQQKLLADEVGRVASEGGDITRLVELSNKSPGELDLELQKMKLVAEGALKAVPQPRFTGRNDILGTPAKRKALSGVLSTNPRIGNVLLNQRGNEINRQTARRKENRAARAAESKAALAAAAPKTKLGKSLAAINADESTGAIQPETATNLRGKARIEALSPASNGKLPPGWRFNEDGSASPIPGGPATQLSGEIAAKAGLITTARSNFKVAEDFLTQDLDPKTFIQQIGDFGEGGRANRAIRFSVEAVLRAASGAAVPETEVTRFMDLFAPRANDTVETARQKLGLLSETLGSIETAIFQGRGGVPGAVSVGGKTFTLRAGESRTTESGITIKRSE